MRWRAIAAAPRAPGASVGDSSSTVASPSAARTRGEAARSRAMRDWIGSRRAGPAAATPPPMTTRLTPRVSASDRIARARWSATRSVISTATSSPAEPGAEDVGGTRMRRQDRAATGGHRLVGLATDRRTGGDGLEAAAQTARAHDSVRIGDDVAHLAGEAVVAAEQRPVENDAGRDAGPDRQEGEARGRLCGVVGRLLAQPERRRAGVVLDEGRNPQLRLQHRSQRQVGDAQVDGHADRAVGRVDVTGDGDADGGDVLSQRWRRASSTSPAIWPTSDDGSVGATCSYRMRSRSSVTTIDVLVPPTSTPATSDPPSPGSWLAIIAPTQGPAAAP